MKKKKKGRLPCCGGVEDSPGDSLRVSGINIYACPGQRGWFWRGVDVRGFLFSFTGKLEIEAVRGDGGMTLYLL
jgi:hypothetical protein